MQACRLAGVHVADAPVIYCQHAMTGIDKTNPPERLQAHARY
jgi:hypothetical protein